MIKISSFSDELIEDLDDMFPERCPEPSMSERQIWIYTGKRLLVRMLKAGLEATYAEDEGSKAEGEEGKVEVNI